MKMSLRNLAGVVLGVGLALVVVVGLRAAKEDVKAGAGAAPVAGPRYSVITSEGHNLIVTDNSTNKLYFYTIEADSKLGEELHLRGHFDLNQVGQKTIKPKSVKLKKKVSE